MTSSNPPPRQRTTTSTNAHRTIISLSRRIPDDILREIFIHCLPQNHNATLCPSDPPILLTHICQRWRRVARSTPRLWSSIHVPPVIESLEVQGHLEGAVCEWIKLAAATPLSLSFPFHIPAFEGQDVIFPIGLGHMSRVLTFPATSPGYISSLRLSVVESEAIISTFIESQLHQPALLSRLQTLHICIEATSPTPNSFSVDWEGIYLRILSKLDLSRVLSLRELWLNLRFYGRYVWNTPHLTRFIPCDHLRVLDLQDCFKTWTDSRSLCAIPAAVIVDIFQRCRNLAVFKADFEEHSGNSAHFMAKHSADTPTTTAPSLRHLSLSFFDFDGFNAAQLLASCHWPELSAVHIRQCPEMRGADQPTLNVVSLANQIRSHLTSLTLGYYALQSDTIINILSTLSSLVQLHLEYAEGGRSSGLPYRSKFKDGVLQSLTPDPSKSPTHSCPRLEYLKWERNAFFTERTLARMLLERATSPHSPVALKQVHIDFGRRISHDILPKCAPLIEAGLDLRLSGLKEGAERRGGHEGGRKWSPKEGLFVEVDHFCWGWV